MNYTFVGFIREDDGSLTMEALDESGKLVEFHGVELGKPELVQGQVVQEVKCEIREIQCEVRIDVDR